MPLRKTPPKVPAPPMLATGAPSFGIACGFARSAPIRVPRTQAAYAIVRAELGWRMMAIMAAAIGGMNDGVTMRALATITKWKE